MKASQCRLHYWCRVMHCVLTAGVFEGLIGPWVHVRMAGWLEKLQSAVEAQERQRQNEREGERQTERDRKGKTEGPCRTGPTKPYGGTERGDVIGLRWDMHTSVPTNRPGVVCVCLWVRVCEQENACAQWCAYPYMCTCWLYRYIFLLLTSASVSTWEP